MSTNFTARARERSKLPVTGTIDHYVSWLDREIYGGKLREQDPVAVAGMSITSYSRSRKPRSAARHAGCRLSAESPPGRGGCRMPPKINNPTRLWWF